MHQQIYCKWKWKWVIGGCEIEEYTFIYKHNNGAKVYESSDGKKQIRFDGLVFRKISEVNKHIEKNRIRLNQEKAKQKKFEEDPHYLTNEDWQKLKCD